MRNIRQINYWKLKLFCEAYICQSYTQASENMHISQTSITKAIDDIESMIGNTLFVKEKNQMFPTKFADELFAKVQPSLAKIYDALVVNGEDNSQISIASTHSALSTVIPVAISLLDGDTSYSLYNTDRSNAISLLRRDMVDIAIFPAFEIPNDLKILHTISLDPAILVHKDNPLVHKKDITREDVFRERLIMIDDYKISENYRELFQSIYDAQRIKIYNADYEMISRFVARGLGSCLYSDVPVDIRNVVCINLSGILPQIKHYAISKITNQTTRVVEFMSSLMKVISDRESFVI